MHEAPGLRLGQCGLVAEAAGDVTRGRLEAPTADEDAGGQNRSLYFPIPVPRASRRLGTGDAGTGLPDVRSAPERRAAGPAHAQAARRLRDPQRTRGSGRTAAAFFGCDGGERPRLLLGGAAALRKSICSCALKTKLVRGFMVSLLTLITKQKVDVAEFPIARKPKAGLATWFSLQDRGSPHFEELMECAPRPEDRTDQGPTTRLSKTVGRVLPLGAAATGPVEQRDMGTCLRVVIRT